jgi:hypothetical protein
MKQIKRMGGAVSAPLIRLHDVVPDETVPSQSDIVH